MPVDRRLAENLARTMVDLYGGVAERLAVDVGRRLDQDLAGDPPDRPERRLLATQALTEESRRLVDRLDTDLGPAVEQMVTLASQRGGAEALRELGRLGLALPSTAAEIRRQLPGAEAAQRLIFSLTSTLRGTHLRITRWPEDVYRQVVSRAEVDVLLGVATRRRAAQKIWEDLVSRGVTGFVDRAGRAWALESYVDMASRTVAAQAAVEAHLDRLGEAGLDLVIVSDAPQECELCRPWEGRVLTRTGGGARSVEVEHATRDGEMITVAVAGSVDDAIGAGLLHPNCRHSLSAYQPGVTPVPDHTADPEGDAARQKLRRLERQVRRDKLVAETALTDQAQRQALARVRATQARIREHVDATGLLRQRHREQLRLGHAPPPGRMSTSPPPRLATTSLPASARPAAPARLATTELPLPARPAQPRQLTHDDAVQMQERMLADQPWTREQMSALAEYSGGGYLDANNVLRGFEGAAEHGDDFPRVQQLIEDAAAGLRPLPEPVIVSRRVHPEAFGDLDISDLPGLIGKTRQEPAFISTSMVGDLGVEVGTVLMEVRVPAGTPAAYIEPITQSEGEFELLLGAGQRYRILDVTTETVETVSGFEQTTARMVVEVVPS